MKIVAGGQKKKLFGANQRKYKSKITSNREGLKENEKDEKRERKKFDGKERN